MDSGIALEHDHDEQRSERPLTYGPTVTVSQRSSSIDRSRPGEQTIDQRQESDADSGSTDMDRDIDRYRRRKALMMAQPNGSIAGPKHGSSQRRSRWKEQPGHVDEDEPIFNAPDDSNGSDFTPSTSDDVELSQMHGDELSMDDEETGLTKRDRRQKRRRKMKDTSLDERILGPSKVEMGQSLADKSVLRASIINILLIASWYCFSLSISIVGTSQN